MEAGKLTENAGCNTGCRACHYKDLSYSDQLERKKAWARSKFLSWGERMLPFVAAPEEERLAYREKSWLRVKVENGNYSFGMFRAVSVAGKWEQKFVAWDTCPVHSIPVQKIIQKLKRVFSSLHSADLEEALEGVWIGIPHLVVITNRDLFEKLRGTDWNSVLEPPFNRVWFHQVNQIGRKIFGHREIVLLFGPETKEAHPIRAFRQVAQSLLIQARENALQALIASAPTLVLDLYSGTGELSLLLSPKTGWIGIEMSKEATDAASTLRRDHVGGARHLAFVGGVEQRLSDPKVLEAIPFDYSLYLNPPRTGLSFEAEEAVLGLLRYHPAGRIVYLSCSASSLARDLRKMEGAGYRVASLQSFDFFPQTEHFETLAVLERA